MNALHIGIVSKELGISSSQVKATALMLDEGASIPFISRYRKETTGSLDEVAVAAIRDRMGKLRELDQRRETIIKSLRDRDLLTDDLKETISAAESMTILEDIYLPFRPKRRTRATMAKEKGLEPLAAMIFKQEEMELETEAASFLDPDKKVHSIDEALAGARDIIAEWVSENRVAREKMRTFFMKKGLLRSKMVKGKEEEGIKYKDYFDWEEPVAKAPSHRILAIRRGEKEAFLTHRITPPEEEAITLLQALFLREENAASEQVKSAIKDSYKRLLSTSIEAETRLAVKKRADAAAIQVFAENLRQLLLAPPLGSKNVMAVDPGFRTGCKLVCLDRQGKLLYKDIIYPTFSDKKVKEAGKTVRNLCNRFKTEAIAIGNGTAGRETASFINSLGLPKAINVVMVNESGASIYSASDVARDEFPDEDVTVRGSVSIGRRLMDPLAELVKIDAKSIGVGQYQHDVDPIALKKSLEDVVASCVNGVGVDVNTASKQLLTYVSGIGAQLAKGIVEYRNHNGPFKSRLALLQVPRLGPKIYEQAAGFLRIQKGKHPLDGSAVHPESYYMVDTMARDLGCMVADLIADGEIRKRIDLSRYLSDSLGMPTLRDIMAELAKPGRDPREQFEAFNFTEGIETLDDVKPGMTLPGIVTNITAFGAFVDIGVHQDGLVHISQISKRFVKNPADVLKLHQKVTVTILEVDCQRKRISMSMKNGQSLNRTRSKEEACRKKHKRELKGDHHEI